jgi:hypothetical protein
MIRAQGKSVSLHDRRLPISTAAIFRFTPESGHVQCTGPCPLWANSGHRVRLFDHLVRSKQHRLRNGETEFFSDFGVDH